MRRVLVTGSREWSDRRVVFNALTAQMATAAPDRIVIIHGACPTGADAIAEAFWKTVWHEGVDIERYPADWERKCDNTCYHKPRTKDGKPYCPMAGPIRNQQMVDLGADVCLAFPLLDSRGTADCMKRAEKAGIPVIDCSKQVTA